MNDDHKPLPRTLTLAGRELATVRDALDALTTDWPEDTRGPRHGEAVDACLKVLDGHRSAVDAEMALQAAAEEAGLELSRGPAQA